MNITTKLLIPLFILFTTGCQLVHNGEPVCPEDLHITKLKNDQYKYIIRNVYIDKMTDDSIAGFTRSIKKVDSNINSVKFDKENNSVEFITSNKVNNLSDFINQLAALSGVTSYWDELLTRHKKDIGFVKNLYQPVIDVPLFTTAECESHIPEIVKVDKVNDSKIRLTVFFRFSEYHGDGDNDYILEIKDSGLLVNYVLQKYHGKYFQAGPGKLEKKTIPYAPKSLTYNIQYEKNKSGVLKLNKKTSNCMFDDVTMIRLFSANNDKYIWEKQTFTSEFAIMVKDWDHDGIDEIFIFDRGTLIVYTQ